MSRRAGIRASRDFLRLWAGETVSQVGSRVTFLALPLVAVVTLDATPLQMGILGALSGVPSLLIGVFAGVWVDRWPRRPVLVAADLGRAALLALVPIAALGGWLRIELLYAVALLTGALALFYDVAYRSYLPALVERDDLVEANSKLELSRSAAEVAGPGLAGGIVQLVSAPVALVVDALSFVVSAALVGSIRQDEARPDVAAGGPSIWREAREGLRFVVEHDVLRALAGCVATLSAFNQMIEAVFLLYLARALDLSPATIGLVFSAGSAGFLAGALLPQRLVQRFGLGPVLAAAVVVIGAGDLLVALAAGPPVVAVSLLIAAEFWFGIGLTVFSVNQVSLRQAVTPDRLQGRMNATLHVMTWAIAPLAALAGGLLGELIGLRATLLLAALGEIAAVLWIVLSRVGRLATHPEPSAEPALAA